MSTQSVQTELLHIITACDHVSYVDSIKSSLEELLAEIQKPVNVLSARDVLHNHMSGIAIPETREEIELYRQRVEQAMEFYADQFRITPGAEELAEIDIIVTLMHNFSDPKELHEARDRMYTLRHLIRTRINKEK